jgi:pilus assembly protein Flp/PilA
VAKLLLLLRRKLGRTNGQGLAEYALILALIALVSIVAVTFMGTQVTAALSSVGHSIQSATP